MGMTNRLSFDAHPKLLASRDAGPTHVALFWSRRTNRAAVVAEDDSTGEVIELHIRPGDDPLDVFDHPFAYRFLAAA